MISHMLLMNILRNVRIEIERIETDPVTKIVENFNVDGSNLALFNSDKKAIEMQKSIVKYLNNNNL